MSNEHEPPPMPPGAFRTIRITGRTWVPVWRIVAVHESTRNGVGIVYFDGVGIVPMASDRALDELRADLARLDGPTWTGDRRTATVTLSARRSGEPLTPSLTSIVRELTDATIATRPGEDSMPGQLAEGDVIAVTLRVEHIRRGQREPVRS